MSISVAMAVCNGEKYIEQQLNSIIHNLKKEDEIIISYNASEDATLEMIEEAAHQLPIIKVYSCEEKGVIANYENAISHCNNEYIFLADQDDVWTDNKVEKVMECFEKEHAILVMHDSQYTDDDLNHQNMTLFTDKDIKQGYVHNLINNYYDGCCLAFHRDLIKMILPIPRSVSMHDQWIGLVAEKVGSVSFCNEKLLQHRRHGDEAKKKYGLSMIFRTSYQVTRRLQEMNSYVRYLNGIWKGPKNNGTEQKEKA